MLEKERVESSGDVIRAPCCPIRDRNKSDYYNGVAGHKAINTESRSAAETGKWMSVDPLVHTVVCQTHLQEEEEENLFPVGKYNVDTQNAYKHQIFITAYRRLPESFYKL